MVVGMGSSLICFSFRAGRSLGVVVGVCGRRASISACSSAEISMVSGIGLGEGLDFFWLSEV